MKYILSIIISLLVFTSCITIQTSPIEEPTTSDQSINKTNITDNETSDNYTKYLAAINNDHMLKLIREKGYEYALENVRILSIYVEDKNIANEAYELTSKLEFTELINTYSKDINITTEPSVVYRDEVSIEIENIIFNMNDNEITYPIKFKNGYYIIKLIEHRHPSVDEIEDLKYRENSMLEDYKKMYGIE